MQIDVLVTAFGDLDPAAMAVHVESLGYGGIWVGELWQESSVVQLAEMARETDEIDLGSAILNVYSRTPAVLAMTAASLQRTSDGRFLLGTGVSTPKAVEDLHGMSFDRPVRRAHETIELVREFVGAGDTEAGEPVAYDGDLLRASDFPALDVPVPIYHAGLGPANRRVVGRLCDGWIPHNIPFSALDEAFEEVAEAARERDRDPDEITVAPYVPAAVGDDPAAARDAIRRHVAYYAGSGDGYRRAVATRFPEAAERVAEAWRAGDRDAAAEAVTDEMVADLGVAGTPADARDQLRTLVAETVIERPMIVVPRPAAAEFGVQTIEALAPDRF